jgi:hypothetical protein
MMKTNNHKRGRPPMTTSERALRRLLKKMRALLEYHPKRRRTWIKHD